jgi:hypothetical protein
MCIAINKPEGKLIPHTYLEQSFLNNDDGAGFMYAEDNQLHIEKGFMEFDDFMNAYTKHEEKPCAVHFRIKTHGATDEANTHPFQVGKTLGFIHNGIIGNVDCSSDKNMSDTHHFNQKFLTKLYKQDSNFIYKDIFHDLIAEYIGNSKLVFLNNKGTSTIVNEKLGKWENGVWYSNTSYMPRVVHKPYVPPVNDARIPQGPIFRQGTEVYVNHPRLRGKGIVKYFGGNAMIGILMHGDKEPSLLPMQCCHPITQQVTTPSKHYVNPYELDDYVVRKSDVDMQMGVVKGTSADDVWVQWLDDYNNPVGNLTVIKESFLELWDMPLGI